MMSWCLFAMLLGPIEQETLDFAGVSTPKYGFVSGDRVYLSYMESIAAFDQQGQVLARFDGKGQGPEEWLGGPIFAFGDQVCGWDVATGRNKILLLNRDLEVQGSARITGSSGMILGLCPGPDQLYVMRYAPVRETYVIDVLDADWSMRHSYDVAVPVDASRIRNMMATVQQIDPQHVALYHLLQNEETYSIVSWDASSQETKLISHRTPSRTKKSASFTPKLFAQGASALTQTALIGNRYHVFFQALVDGRRDQQTWFHHTFDRSMKPIATRQLDVDQVIMTPGPTDRVIYYLDDRGITFMPPSM